MSKTNSPQPIYLPTVLGAIRPTRARRHLSRNSGISQTSYCELYFAHHAPYTFTFLGTPTLPSSSTFRPALHHLLNFFCSAQTAAPQRSSLDRRRVSTPTRIINRPILARSSSDPPPPSSFSSSSCTTTTQPPSRLAVITETRFSACDSSVTSNRSFAAALARELSRALACGAT